ncbi:LysR family transcriptional regulator [Ureibacillus aquaedulcis]|uniref:LysR family transcriptional regulator n=1 Tax=Ureibacillus aquaedulcis TaxID=3058421 RepID=A0ABT8GM99_9BACL|nr:LysR family transcriptional regulator [Ureibacillus sp. BA0131]MDN4492534.1 LysR family transcriptional regulator [Ureibacillus sp. BA0131]
MLKHIDYVYEVYLNKSFSKAAEVLYISQPALSTAIRKIEDEIGLSIFDRSSNPVQLTPAGEFYIESIEKIMTIERELQANLNRLLDNSRGTINVGGASFFCVYLLPTLVQEFQSKYPNYTVNLVEANAEDLIKCLRSGIVDIIIDVEKRDPKIFDSVVWAEEQILLAVPTSYGLNKKLKKYRLTFDEVASGQYLDAKYEKVNLSEFQNENFLLLKKGNDMHQRSLKMCRNAGFSPKVSMHLDQLLTSYYIASNGKGIAFVRAGITRYLEATNKVFFYKINDENSNRNIMLYHKKKQPLSKVGMDFIRFLNNKKPVSI